MNCGTCGNALLPDEKFCSNCGAPRPAGGLAASDRFGQVETEYVRLKGQVRAGRLTQEQFEAALQPLMFQDEQGHYWMIGVESGNWHMFDGQQWLQKDRPAAVATSTAPLPTSMQPEQLAAPPGLPAASSRARLAVMRGSANMPLLEFGREGATIGRATSNSLVLNDTQVSRLHARIDCDSGNWSIRDLNSRNGTYVNGKRIAVQPLRSGDQISVGVTMLTFQM